MSNSRSFRGLLLSAAIATAVFCAGSTPARAQPSQISIIVDENGHGTINGFVGLLPLSSSIIPDPGPGGKPNVLAYDLQGPPGLVAGDLIIKETVDLRSDLIRFDSGLGTLFFYSDQDQDLGAGALADIGLPGGLNTNLVSVNEVSLGALGFGAIYRSEERRVGKECRSR